MREAGVRAVAVEVSAQALTHHRVDGLLFDVAGFTNLSHDHLDDYADMEEYFQAKLPLFQPELAKRAVVCLDTPYGARVVEEARIPVTTIATIGHAAAEDLDGADWTVEILDSTPVHTEFRLTGPDGRSLVTREPLIGWHMAANAALGIVMLVEAGFELAAIEAADLARVYGEEIAALGEAGCRYLQLDEVNLAYLCDPKLQDQVRNIGEDPKTLPRTYARLINGAIARRAPGMRLTMHLCRGNFQSAWVAEGGYEPVAEILFNEIGVDGYFLEYDDPRSGNFEPLRFVPKGKMVVLGLVTSKLAALESKDELKRRIDEAARYCPLEQLALSPQCGFSSTIEGNRLTIEDQFAKLRMIVEVAREVWGD
jgi:hypothetical protein